MHSDIVGKLGMPAGQGLGKLLLRVTALEDLLCLTNAIQESRVDNACLVRSIVGAGHIQFKAYCGILLYGDGV